MTANAEKAGESPANPKEEKDLLPTQGSTTEHHFTAGGADFHYSAVADWITLRDIHTPVAKMFHTAYLQAGAAPATRPITFVFNGGPGAASAFLHMGAVGPERIVFGEDGALPKPPTRVVANAESWLPFTDLVFIDPIGTGFSRALEEPKKKDGEKPGAPKENPEFWEIDRDLDSLAEFISRFLSAHGRWVSPLFVAGESYGGYRVAKMVRKLQEGHGLGLNGALLISPAIEIDSLNGSDYDLRGWVDIFPSLAASAFHHGRSRSGESSFESVLENAEAFAENDFTRWLTQGEGFPEGERAEVVGRAADQIGLTPEFVARAGGRISSTRFCRELLRDERRLLGHYDGSVSTADPFPDRPEYEGPDPTLFSIDRLYTTAVNHHLRTQLKVDTVLDYRLLSMTVNESWKDKKRAHVFQKPTGALDDMRYGMSLNEHTKVMINHGYFDLVTPYFSSERLIRQMKLTPELRRNVTTRHFKGGHMFYSWDESRVAFTDTVRTFYEQAL